MRYSGKRFRWGKYCTYSSGRRIGEKQRHPSPRKYRSKRGKDETEKDKTERTAGDEEKQDEEEEEEEEEENDEKEEEEQGRNRRAESLADNQKRRVEKTRGREERVS